VGQFRTKLCGVIAAGGFLGLALAMPRVSNAYDASLGWQPTSGASGYTVYIRYGATGTPQPTDVGRPATSSDGLVHVVMYSLPLGPTANFWVTAYDVSRVASPASTTLSITYAQAAAVSDTDRDGLTDAQEDKDLDRVVDAGETNPADADSDNDGYSDGSEKLVYFTDPLNAASYPVIPPPPPPPSSTTTTTTTTTSTTSTTRTTTTTLGSQCSRDSQCNDLNPCTIDDCVSKRCAHAPTLAGTCDDGNPCSVGVACSAGVCTGWVLDCSHLDGACTYGVCDAQVAECKQVKLASGTRCDDGSGCTTGDVCSSTAICNGTNACTSGTFCDSATKTCKSSTEVWVSATADPTATFYGAMTSGTAYADGADADTAANSIEPELVYAASSTNDFNTQFADRVSYLVRFPVSGTWYMWGRFYYPNAPGGTGGNSFYVRVDSGAALRFGNNNGYFRRWHWGGDGRYDTGTPVALPLGQLAAGNHTVTIAKREVTPNAPRLDVLVFTRNASWLPTDAKVRLP
jgi:hypothetical protein